MMTSATKSEEKRRDWSVQRGVDHNKIRVNQAVETRNRAQFLGQVPKQQRKSYRRLARGTKHRQHARKGILLGECRLKRYAKQHGSLLWTTGTTRNTEYYIIQSGVLLLRPMVYFYSGVDSSPAGRCGTVWGLLDSKFEAGIRSLARRSPACDDPGSTTGDISCET